MQWEMGSEFAWPPPLLREGEAPSLIDSDARFFSTARGAFAGLFSQLQTAVQASTLHLPSFFCMDVAYSLASIVDIQFYRDDPREPEPDWSSMTYRSGDMLMILNPFGLRDGAAWDYRKFQELGVVVIEDHTHDPWSEWAKSSSADFCIASLRKTLPLPDGAVVWSPVNRSLPSAANERSHGAHLKLTAMLLKQAYLENLPIEKRAFREMQLEGERLLAFERAQVSALSAGLLPVLNVDAMRKRREANARYFIEHLESERVRPLFSTWPEGGCPFNPVVVCDSHDIREQLRKYLIERSIFAPIHWEQTNAPMNSGHREVIGLTSSILTIPTDFRYSLEDIDIALGAIVDFEKGGRSAV